MINATRIEYYNGPRLVVGVNAAYTINSVGGSVVLRYHVKDDNTGGTWLIESQFVGNARGLPSIVPRPNK